MATLPNALEIYVRNYINDLIQTLGQNDTPGSTLPITTQIDNFTNILISVTLTSFPAIGYPITVNVNGANIDGSLYTIDSSGQIITFIPHLVTPSTVVVTYSI